MTVRENVGRPDHTGGPSEGGEGRRSPRPRAILQMDAPAGTPPPSFAGAASAGVAIGRAIVRDPTVFLFDEPLSKPSNAALRIDMRMEIGKLHKTLGANLKVYVNPRIPVEAMTLADKIRRAARRRVDAGGRAHGPLPRAPEPLRGGPFSARPR